VNWGVKQEHSFYEKWEDGNQKKSYLYIDDCINALTIGIDQINSGLEIFNLGWDDQVDTNNIAQIIIDELGLHPEIKNSCESKDGRGWISDIKNMLLFKDILKKIGWRINYWSKDTVSLTVMNMIDHDYDIARPHRSAILIKSTTREKVHSNKILYFYIIIDIINHFTAYI